MDRYAARSTLLLGSALALLFPTRPAYEDDWLSGAKATGDWGGARSDLADRGVDLGLDYAAEGYVSRKDSASGFRGNLDLTLSLDSEKLGLWPGAEIFVYGQLGHGAGISEELALAMPLSNLEAPDFKQLSELWINQDFGEVVSIRLGKQDANRDFGGPRFGGNFINSSFGVIPTIPMPSFPAPALGMLATVHASPWLNAEAGVYEGASEAEKFVGSGFTGDDGLFAVFELEATHDVACREDAATHNVGVWKHTGTDDRAGVFVMSDLLFPLFPEIEGDTRSFQAFVRGGFTEASADAPDLYVGGGATAHGFLGRNNTFGLGFGYLRSPASRETFVEAFFKLRAIAWLTLEPDAQVFFDEGKTNLVVSLRTKLKL